MSLLKHLSDGQEALLLAQRLKPEFAGREPHIQSAALAELVATFVSGCPEEMRVEVMASWLDAVRKLVMVADYERQYRAKPSH